MLALVSTLKRQVEFMFEVTVRVVSFSVALLVPYGRYASLAARIGERKGE